MMLNECLIRRRRTVNVLCAQNIHTPKHLFLCGGGLASEELELWIGSPIAQEVLIDNLICLFIY